MAKMRRFRRGDVMTLRQANDLVDSRNRFENLIGDGIIQIGKTGAGVIVGVDVRTLAIALGIKPDPAIDISSDFIIQVDGVDTTETSLVSVAPGDWRGRMVGVEMAYVWSEATEADFTDWVPITPEVFKVGTLISVDKNVFSFDVGGVATVDFYVDEDDGHLYAKVTAAVGIITIGVILRATRSRAAHNDPKTPDLFIG